MCTTTLLPIHTCCEVEEGNYNPAGKLLSNSPLAVENLDQKGYLLIQNLWNRGMDIIHGMCVVNTDALSHLNKSLEHFLQTEEKEKKNKYMDSCLQKRRHINHFFSWYMAYLAWRRRLRLNAYPDASQQSGNSPTPALAST